MAWTAELVSKTHVNHITTFLVRFSDGTRSIDQQFNDFGTDIDGLKQQVAKYLKQLELSDQIDAAYSAGPIAGDPEDAALAKFKNDLRRMRALNQLVDWGVVQANNAQVTNTRTAISDALTANPGWLTLV